MGWLNADSREAPHVDVCCDLVVDGLPQDDDSIDIIVGGHGLQQLAVYDVWVALEEFNRVLKPSGVLRLCLADLDASFGAYAALRPDKLWTQSWDTVIGNLVSQLTEDGRVRTPMNYRFAEELLFKAGFVHVGRVGFRETTTRHQDIVELDTRPTDSFYVEAYKKADCPRSAPAPAAAGQIHLSWSREPSTTLTVVWHTARGTGSALAEFREQGSTAWKRVPCTTRASPGRGMLHEATAENLLPGTAYEYRVSGDAGAEPAMSRTLKTRTAPPRGPADFRFAFVCDTGVIGRPDGNTTGTQQVIKELVDEDPLFVLGGGDYAYAQKDARYARVGDAIDAWFEQMEELVSRCPLMAQYGNHEVFLKERFRDWAPRFAHPEGSGDGKCYSFDVGDVHFAALFAPGPVLAPEHLLWLHCDLADARMRGLRWLVVFQHEPVYGHGASHPADPGLRRVIAPVLERHRVDLHLSGHDQNYERTYPLLGVPSAPRAASTAPNRYEAGLGVIYAKVSPGGKMSEKRDDFSRFAAEPPPVVAVRDDSLHHYALVSVRRQGELELTTYGLAGDGSPRRVLDSFRILAR